MKCPKWIRGVFPNVSAGEGRIALIGDSLHGYPLAVPPPLSRERTAEQ